MFSLIRTVVFCIGLTALAADMPLPWTRELELASPAMAGNDVIIAQNLLLREPAVDAFPVTGKYDEATEAAAIQFQTAQGLKASGVFDEDSASKLLALYSNDQVKDTGFTAASMGYKYKISISVFANRSLETSGTLYDAYNTILLTFPVRTHGHRNDGSQAAWPDMGNGDVGLNQFTSNGATVSGLIEVDLNTPEPDPALYGPWPVTRLVRGLQGNAAFLLPTIRDGQLIHTGNWTSGGWTPAHTMPDSSGCVHTHPHHVYEIWQALVKLGVTVNENTFSGVDYPYKPQGILVVEMRD
jgi:hypothetical protein